jgi:riboflavin kinase/FMN adenylyltransferase
MKTVPQVFPGLAAVRLPEKRSCHVAVGMFDGVHRGHRAVIEGAVHAARATGGLAGVLTFWPHPSRLFRPDAPVRMIFDAAVRRELLFEVGVDFVIEEPFTSEFAAISAEGLVPHVKQAMPRLVTLYVGENWRFGRGRAGDVPALVRFARASGVNVVSVVRLNYNGEPVSSTRIRATLEAGAMEEAGELLGFPYFCTGTVVPGRRLGRQIGFPTLNLDWRPDHQPSLGVYVVSVRAAGSAAGTLPAVANFGVRPTVDGSGAPVLEVHVLAETCPFRTGDRLHVDWLHRQRPEQKFGSVEELRAQIARDRDAACGFFGL